MSFLLYGLLDVIIDGYFTAVQQFDDYYDEVSEGLFNETPLDSSQQKQWFEMRRAMVRFHRLVVPMREVIRGQFFGEESDAFEEELPEENFASRIDDAEDEGEE